MKQLLAASAVAALLLAPSAAGKSDHATVVQKAKQRYYHANGYIKAIGKNARRTIYHPNHTIRTRWQKAVRYLIKVRHDAWQTMHPKPVYQTVPQIICAVFGPYCSQALAVATCESTLNIYAVNGQYLGIFQLGTRERAIYATQGYSTAYEQTVAAHNYFLAAGWGPWECRP